MTGQKSSPETGATQAQLSLTMYTVHVTVTNSSSFVEGFGQHCGMVKI